MKADEKGEGFVERAKDSATCENSQPAGSPPSEIARLISERKFRCVCVPREMVDEVNIELKKLGATPCPIVKIEKETDVKASESPEPPIENAGGEKCVNLFVLFSPEKFVDAITAAKEGDKA
jgi:hypothetical protein